METIEHDSELIGKSGAVYTTEVEASDDNRRRYGFFRLLPVSGTPVHPYTILVVEKDGEISTVIYEVGESDEGLSGVAAAHGVRVRKAQALCVAAAEGCLTRDEDFQYYGTWAIPGIKQYDDLIIGESGEYHTEEYEVGDELVYDFHLVAPSAHIFQIRVTPEQGGFITTIYSNDMSSLNFRNNEPFRVAQAPGIQVRKAQALCVAAAEGRLIHDYDFQYYADWAGAPSAN
jgi:hypothetical protein